MFGWMKKIAKQTAPDTRLITELRNAIPLRNGQDHVLAGEYAMWFPTLEDPRFSASPALGQIDRLYLASGGMEETLYAAILCRLRAEDGEAKLLALPEDAAVFPVLGTGDKGFLLSASQEKGIRLHFHRSTSARLRSDAMEELAFCLEEWRQRHRGIATELPPSSQHAGLGWWSLMKQAATELESRGDPLLSIGKIMYQ